MANVQAPTTPVSTPATQFRSELDKRSGEIKAVLSHGLVSPEIFKQVVMTAVQEKPELLAINNKTLMDAFLKCAKDGLLPDGKEAALVIFNSKDLGKSVSYMPMVDGIKKQIWRSGKITYISAHAVYKGDTFDYCLGDREFIEHKPAMENRGSICAAYAIVKTAEGEYMREVLTLEEIEKLRLAGKNASGNCWDKWYDQMAIKSAIHRLSKRLDLSVKYEVDEDYNEIPYSEPPKLVAPEATLALAKPPSETKQLTNATEAQASPAAESNNVNPKKKAPF